MHSAKLIRRNQPSPAPRAAIQVAALFLCLGFPLMIAGNAQSGPIFAARFLSFDVGANPTGIAIGDVNGDGQPDTKAELLAYLSSVPTCGSSDGLDCFNSPTGRGPLLDIDSTGDALNHYLGKPTPDWQGSLGANFRLGHSWSINTLFEYKVGNYAVSDLTDAFRMSNPLIGRNLVDAAKTEAVLDNPASTPEQRLQALVDWAYKYKSLSPYSGLHLTQNGDFMRFRELGITYTAPQSFAQKLGLRNLSFNAAGRNVALWTGYTGIDPEANAVGVGDGSQLDQNYLDAVDAWGFPLPRSFTFSVRFGF